MIWLSDAYLERYAALDRADPRRKALLEKMKKHDMMTFERLRPLPAYRADALLARAKLLDAEGRLPEAERNFRKSIEEAERFGRRYSLARASLEYGRFLSKNGRKGEAEGSIARAYRLFREMGTGDSSAPVPAFCMDGLRAPEAARATWDGKDLRFMARLAQLSGRAEWEAAMEELAGMIGERAPAEFVCVIGVDPATEELKILGVAGLESPAALKDALSLPAVYTAIARRETYMSGDSACVPVLVRGAIRGACYLGNPRSGAPVAADLEPAASLAAHACQVWENLSLDPGRSIGIDPESFSALCDEADLTKRERELLLLVVKGRSNKEICVSQSISISTLRTHLNHVYLKVGTSDREGLIARFSSKLGLG